MNALAISVRWDWFKLARRWMPWILLVILLLMSQLAIWANYFGYQSLHQTGGTIPLAGGPGRRPIAASCKDVLAGNVAGLPPNTSPEVLQALQTECRQTQIRLNQQLGQFYRTFTLPGSISSTLGLAVSVELILLAILTASHLGAEYGWGTVRPNLARGIGRWQFVASRLILLVILAGAALLVVVAAIALSSVVAASLTMAPEGFSNTATWSDALLAIAKGWVACIPYIAFAGFATLLTRSTAAGMAIAIGYVLGEQIVVAILGGLFSWFGMISRYFLAQNLGAWAGLSFFAQGQTSVSSQHAFLMLLVYTIVLGDGAFLLFEMRDVSGASGG